MCEIPGFKFTISNIYCVLSLFFKFHWLIYLSKNQWNVIVALKIKQSLICLWLWYLDTGQVLQSFCGVCVCIFKLTTALRWWTCTQQPTSWESKALLAFFVLHDIYCCFQIRFPKSLTCFNDQERNTWTDLKASVRGVCALLRRETGRANGHLDDHRRTHNCVFCLQPSLTGTDCLRRRACDTQTLFWLMTCVWVCVCVPKVSLF